MIEINDDLLNASALVVALAEAIGLSEAFIWLAGIVGDDAAKLIARN